MLPEQPDLPRELVSGALRATFIAGTQPLPRTARDFTAHIAARRGRYGALWRELTQCVSSALVLADDALRNVDHAANLPNPSITDIAEQIGWLVFPGFAAGIPLDRLREYPRYLKAVRLRIERGDLDPQKEQRKHETVAPYWERYTGFMTTLPHQPPHNPKALEAYRWLVEEWRVSVWAQELRTAVPVSIQRLDTAWSAVLRP